MQCQGGSHRTRSPPSHMGPCYLMVLKANQDLYFQNRILDNMREPQQLHCGHRRKSGLFQEKWDKLSQPTNLNRGSVYTWEVWRKPAEPGQQNPATGQKVDTIIGGSQPVGHNPLRVELPFHTVTYQTSCVLDVYITIHNITSVMK